MSKKTDEATPALTPEQLQALLASNPDMLASIFANATPAQMKVARTAYKGSVKARRANVGQCYQQAAAALLAGKTLVEARASVTAPPKAKRPKAVGRRVVKNCVSVLLAFKLAKLDSGKLILTVAPPADNPTTA